MSRRARALAVAVALAAGGAGGLAAQIDPFYLDLEREAQTAAARDDAASAARLYRIACFGMLDEPPRLAACTVRLALAQAAAGDREGFRDSFGRLVVVEERFQGLTLAEVDPEARRELGRFAAAWLPAESLRALPEVAALVAAEKAAAAERGAKPREKRRRKPKTAPEEAPEVPAAAPSAAGESEEAPAAPPAPRPLDDAEQARLAAARGLVASRPPREVLLAEVAALREIADRHPEETEVARLAGDLAYRAGAWSECADFYRRAGDPGAEAPLARFYMAVCLYETGRGEAAAALLAPSVERLRRSPFVDAYVEKILGRDRFP